MPVQDHPLLDSLDGLRLLISRKKQWIENRSRAVWDSSTDTAQSLMLCSSYGSSPIDDDSTDDDSFQVMYYATPSPSQQWETVNNATFAQENLPRGDDASPIDTIIPEQAPMSNGSDKKGELTPFGDDTSAIDKSIPEQAPQMSKRNDKKGKHVSFGNVAIREHPVIMGDHPSARGGVPITIDWAFEEGETMSVVEFDKARARDHKTDTSMTQREKFRRLRLSTYYRRTLLRELEYSGNEIKLREQEMLKIQWQRKTTKLFIPLRKFEENLKDSFAKTNCLANKKTVPVTSDDPEKRFGSKRIEDDSGPPCST